MGHQQPSIVAPPGRLECEVKQPLSSLPGERRSPAMSGRLELSQTLLETDLTLDFLIAQREMGL
jgi:hypothetical protein